MTPLGPKQAAFVREYLLDLNATQAAIRAGYSAKTAKQQGSRLLTNAVVQVALNTAVQKRAEKTELSAEKVLGDIARIAKAAEDIGELGSALNGLRAGADQERAVMVLFDELRASLEVSRLHLAQLEFELRRVRKGGRWERIEALKQLVAEARAEVEREEARLGGLVEQLSE